jgi:hypothetical protein
MYRALCAVAKLIADQLHSEAVLTHAHSFALFLKPLAALLIPLWHCLEGAKD